MAPQEGQFLSYKINGIPWPWSLSLQPDSSTAARALRLLVDPKTSSSHRTDQPKLNELIDPAHNRFPEPPEDPPTLSSPKRFVCDVCGKDFSRARDRKLHYEGNHAATPMRHKCIHCDKDFSRYVILAVLQLTEC